jgi:hypothetical protein
MEIFFVHIYKKAPFFPLSEIIDAYKCAVSWQITSERDQFRLNMLLFCILCLKNVIFIPNFCEGNFYGRVL